MKSLIEPFKVLTLDLLISDRSMFFDPQDGSGLSRLAAQHSSKGLKEGSKDALTENAFGDFARTTLGRDAATTPGGSSANTTATLSRLLNDSGKPDQREINVDFIGITAQDNDSQVIRGELKKAGIRLLEPKSDRQVKPAVSYVLKYPRQPHQPVERSIFTWKGNAHEIIKPDFITPEMVDNSDAVLVQGSLWQKFQATPKSASGSQSGTWKVRAEDMGVADKLLDLRWKRGKELWLTLPTHAKFGEDNSEHFQWLLKSANLILANDEELARVLTSKAERDRLDHIISAKGIDNAQHDDGKKNELQFIEIGREVMRDAGINFNNVMRFDENIDAIRKKSSPGEMSKRLEEYKKCYDILQARSVTAGEFAEFDFAHHSIIPEEGLRRLREDILPQKFLEKASHDPNPEERWTGENKKQIAFITRGTRGSVVLAEDEKGQFQQIDITRVIPRKIESTLGAGDTSFAGFLAGYRKGLTPEECGKVASAIAAENLGYDGAQLPDPMQTLRDSAKAREMAPKGAVLDSVGLDPNILRKIDHPQPMAQKDATENMPNGRRSPRTIGNEYRKRIEGTRKRPLSESISTLLR